MMLRDEAWIDVVLDQTWDSAAKFLQWLNLLGDSYDEIDRIYLDAETIGGE